MIAIVPVELLKQLAAEAPQQAEFQCDPFQGTGSTNNGTASNSQTSNGAMGNGEYHHRLMVERWLQDRGIPYRVKPEPDGKGRTVYVLKQCPFDPSHGDPDSCIMQEPGGKLSAHCFHDSCGSYRWQDFKEKIGKPEAKHYHPPLQKQRSSRNGTARSSKGHKSPAGAIEEDDDPHRLAHLYLKGHSHDDTNTIVYWREEFLLWNGQCYRVMPSRELIAELTECVKAEFDRLNIAKNQKRQNKREKVQQVTTALINNVKQALGGLCLLPSVVEEPSWRSSHAWSATETLACRNGLLHLPSLVSGLDHLTGCTPLFFSRNALDYDFNLTAPPPVNWLAFLGQLWPDDPQSIGALQEWMGYCLLPDTRQQKILMLIGPRRSGKGTIARVLTDLVGKANVAGPTLSSLGTNFGLWPLLGKTVAVVSDARLSGRTDAATVTERLLSISGEDALTVDRKNLAPVTTKLLTRFAILTNELPRLGDASGALTGRMVQLRLTRSWYGEEDTGLTDRLLTELPGILLWAIAGWERLRQPGHFVQPDSSKELLGELEDLSSPVGAFVRERCVVAPGARVSIADLCSSWKRWCELTGRREPGTEATFGRDLLAAVPTARRTRPRDGLPEGGAHRPG
jgi:putative DNA primase/helicase